MAFSVNTPVGDGVTKQFAVNFTNGLFSRDSVHVFVEGEVDGLGEPVERTFTWINDGLIELEGSAPGSGVVVNIRRIMDKEEPAVDFEDGEILTEETMDRSQDHLLNSIHELLDGYGFENVQTDMSLNGNSLLNVGDVEAESLTINGIELTDSVDLAERWANEDEDVIVEEGKYSAKHYSIKAEASADRVDLGALDQAVDAAELAETNALGSAQEALDSADRAEDNANRSQSQADSSASDADRAEAARDSAFVNADVYPDVATGRAAVVDGEQFQVVEGDEIVRYRRDSASTQTEVARYPAAAAVREITEKFLGYAPKDVALAFVDDAGLACLIVINGGEVRVDRLSAEKSIMAPAVGNEEGWMEQVSPVGFAYSVLDLNGMMAFGIKTDGSVVSRNLDGVATINGIAIEEYRSGGSGGTTAIDPPRFMAEIVHIISYGQSLSVGKVDLPEKVVTTTSAYDNLRFAGGVRSQDDPNPYTALVPLIETHNGDTLGETPISGAADMIKERIFADNGLEYTDYSYQLLGSAPGAGGTQISGLMPGTVPFNRMVADMQAGHDLAQADGKLFKVGTMFWTQAESDYINNTPAETYKQRFRDLVAAMDAGAKDITGQVEDVEVIGYQVQGHGTYEYPQNPYLAAAQLELSEEMDHYHIACPLYWSPQTVHQSALNYRRLGAYYGLCHKRVGVDHKIWKPLSPAQISAQGNIILARFHVPHGSLVFDAATVPPSPNMGFRVVDGTLADITINRVEIVGPDTVKIVCASPVVGGRLRYGFTSGRGGNLRDRQGEKIVFDAATNPFPMHNWCVIFDKAI